MTTRSSSSGGLTSSSTAPSCCEVRADGACLDPELASGYMDRTAQRSVRAADSRLLRRINMPRIPLDREQLRVSVDLVSARDVQRGRRYCLGVLVDGLLVEGVQLGDLGGSAGAADLPRHVLQLAQRPAGEIQFRPLAGEGDGDGAPDRAARAVDHGIPVLQQHFPPPRVGGCYVSEMANNAFKALAHPIR